MSLPKYHLTNPNMNFNQASFNFDQVTFDQLNFGLSDFW